MQASFLLRDKKTPSEEGVQAIDLGGRTIVILGTRSLTDLGIVD